MKRVQSWKWKWNTKRFKKKVKKIGRVISNIGLDDIGHPPVIIGVAEVENEYVLQELVASEYLKSKNYKIVHFDSPDERGIDTALLYRSEYFEVINAKAHTIIINNEEGERDFTRDIVHVQGALDGESVHILVNHWPSRRAGVEETAFRRMAVANEVRGIISMITSEEADAKIIVMGDFNDDPHSASIQQLISTDFYNPMELLLTNEDGSLSY